MYHPLLKNYGTCKAQKRRGLIFLAEANEKRNRLYDLAICAVTCYLTNALNLLLIYTANRLVAARVDGSKSTRLRRSQLACAIFSDLLSFREINFCVKFYFGFCSSVSN